MTGSTSHYSFCLSLVVAVARNGVIGAKGRIPWHLPAELKIFRAVTMGHHIVMGRRTWESMGRLLPGRITVILTRQPEYAVEGAIVAHSFPAALEACRGDDEVVIIGGVQPFHEALPIADRLHYTVVDADPDGDTFMPDIDWTQWREASSTAYAANAYNPFAFRYCVYDRTKT